MSEKETPPGRTIDDLRNTPVLAGEVREPIRDSTRFCVTAVMGMLGGALAVPCVMLALYTMGHGSLFPLYIVLIGPMVEEMLKQSGMLFLLERRPWLIAKSWQFPLGAILGGLTFSVLENLIYQHVFLTGFPPEWRNGVMIYRWTVCTMLHVACSGISGFGLLTAWRRARETGEPFHFKHAFVYTGWAIAVHCGYNLVVTLLAASPVSEQPY